MYYMGKHFTQYSPEEDKIITDNFSKMGRDVYKLLPDRTRESVLNRAKRLGFYAPPVNKNAWTQAEIDILRKHYNKMGGDVHKLLPNRNKPSIHNKAHMLGIPCPSNWPREEDRIIVKTCYDYTTATFEYDNSILGLLPNRSEDEIKSRILYLAEHRTCIGYPINAYIAIKGTYKGYNKVSDIFYEMMDAVFDAIRNNTNNLKVGEKIVEALELHYKLGFDIVDVAAELNISTDMARWLINNGIRFMKQALVIKKSV